MQVLNNERLDVFLQTQEMHLPQVILRMVASRPGHIGQLKQRIKKWYAGANLECDVREIVNQFVDRGDLEIGDYGIIRCVPPFLVSPAANATWAELYGNPLVEESLCGLQATVAYNMHEGSFERRIYLETVTHDQLNNMGVPVFYGRDVASRVPYVAQLRMPSPTDCPTFKFVGKWERFDPSQSPLRSPWVELKPPVFGEHLIRRVEAERHEYYLYVGPNRAIGITSDDAALWRFELSRRAGRAVPWRWEEGVWIQKPLPQAVARMLRLVSTGPAKHDGRYIFYPVPNEFLKVVEELASRLGTNLI